MDWYPLTKALSFTLYAFSFEKHPIQDLVRICIQGFENSQTLATGCFKVTTRLPSWHGGWFILPATAQHVRDMKCF
jgi:hypothetical protein